MFPVAAPRPSHRVQLAWLVLLAAVLPEAITGSTPPAAWFNPFQVLVLLWLYGSGVLVCRELAVRWRAGWPGIALLGMAYGIVEEGFAVKTIFDPLSAPVGDLGAYGHLWGVNWVWAVWICTFHAAFSIGFPIFLVEWRWPAIRGRPLLSRRGLAAALALLAGIAVFGQAVLTAYRPGVPELVGAVLVVLLLGWAARTWAGRRWERLPPGRLPRPRTFAAAGVVFWLLSFLVYAGGPTFGKVPAITYLEGGGLAMAVLLLLRRAAGRPDAERQRFAFVAGSIGFFSAFAVVLEISGIRGMSVVGIGFLVLVAWLYRHRGQEPPPAGVPPPAAERPPGWQR